MKYTAITALAQLQKILENKPVDVGYDYLDEDDAESTPRENVVDFNATLSPDHTRAAMVEYLYLFRALNGGGGPSVEYLDMVARQDWPDSPYKHILAYGQEVQIKNDFCPRKFLFGLGCGADIDYVVAKLADEDKS